MGHLISGQSVGKVFAACLLTGVIWGVYSLCESGHFPYISRQKGLAYLPSDITKGSIVKFQDTLQRKKPSSGVITIKQWQDSLKQNLKNGDKRGIAQSHFQLGELHKGLQNPADAVAHYLMAKKQYEQLSQHSQEIEVLHKIATLYYQQQQFAQSLSYATQAHRLAKEIDNDSLIAVSALQLAKAYDGLGKEDRATDLYNMGLTFFKRLNKSRQLADIYHWLAESYEDAGQLDSTIKYHKEALSIRQDLGDSVGLAESYHQLGLAFSSKDDMDLALNHLHQAAHIHNQLDRPLDAARSYIEISELHAEAGNMDSSLEYATRALNTSDSFSAINLKVNAMRLSLGAHASLGHMGRVVEFQRQLDDLQDSLEILREKEHQKEVLFQVNVDQKVYKLKQLEKKHAEQQARLEHEHLMLIFAIIVLIFLIVILVLLYNRYQYRKRTEKATKEKNSQLKKLNSRLEALNEEKNELMQTVTHDLKNPLTGIIGLSTLAQMEKGSISREELLEYIDQIASVAHQMNDMIKKLLDIRSIESGDNHLEIKPNDVISLTKEVIKNNKSAAADKNLDILFETKPSVEMVMGDDTAIKRVLDNFVSNAIKYSPQGKKIYVTADRNNGSIRVKVKDEGPGLSQKDQQKLFLKFARLSPRPTGNETSTGLGLYIVKQLADQMNGTVGCISTEGHGATFYVELPVNKS